MKGVEIGAFHLGVPIIQGGMGVGISLGGLAGAVAHEGGMGIISTAQIGFKQPDFMKNVQEANLRAIDLQIKKGVVKALVQGRRVRPYKVTIEIQPISQTRLNKIKKVCEKRITDIEALMNGDFPEDLQELFLNKEGLFPGPRQISFDCSCPDWARLCKHVAAVLYGIGAMFDENPFLFFELRGIDVNSLVSEALINHVDQMLSHAHVHTKRMIDDKDISDIFQLDVK